jgi:hypothetical protein
LEFIVLKPKISKSEKVVSLPLCYVLITGKNKIPGITSNHYGLNTS